MCMIFQFCLSLNKGKFIALPQSQKLYTYHIISICRVNLKIFLKVSAIGNNKEVIHNAEIIANNRSKRTV